MHSQKVEELPGATWAKRTGVTAFLFRVTRLFSSQKKEGSQDSVSTLTAQFENI